MSGDLSCIVKSMEPWLVVVCTVCVLWLVMHRVRITTSNFSSNPFNSALGHLSVDDSANRVRSEPAADPYWSGTGSNASGFKAKRRSSTFMSEPPVFYPPIGEVQDALGSWTDMANQSEMINSELTDQTAGADGFQRNNIRDGFKRNQSGFASANLMKALNGGA